jgi:hypothetical protein
MNFYDPHILYVISDNPCRSYYGSVLITDESLGFAKYMLAINDENEYVIYLCKHDRTPIPISWYKDPQEAFEALRLINNIGSSDQNDRNIYNIITSYIDRNISCNELIHSIIFAIYPIAKNDPTFQILIQIVHNSGADKSQKDISRMLREDLGRWTSAQFQCLKPNAQDLYRYMNLYSSIYNLIVEYNFFDDKKYHVSDGDINLKDVISKIHDIEHRWCLDIS